MRLWPEWAEREANRASPGPAWMNRWGWRLFGLSVYWIVAATAVTVLVGLILLVTIFVGRLF